MNKHNRVYAKALIVVLCFSAFAFGSHELVSCLDEPYHITIAGVMAVVSVVAATVLGNLLYDYWESENE